MLDSGPSLGRYKETRAHTGVRVNVDPPAPDPSIAKAYGQLKSGLTGMNIPMVQLAQIPLWDNTVFQTNTGVSYRCPKLMRMGVYQVGDLLVGDKLDEEKLRHIAPTWRELYRRGIMWMLRQRDGGKEEISIGGQHLAMEQWSMKNVGRAVVAASTPEERQFQEVWAVLDKPRGGSSLLSGRHCGRNWLPIRG